MCVCLCEGVSPSVPAKEFLIYLILFFFFSFSAFGCAGNKREEK